MASLNPAMTVGAQIAETLTLHRGLRGRALDDRVLELLRQVRISDPERRVHAYPHQMSGGIRQRVAGAIAISCQPSLLIADEPTTSLDVTIQAQYLRLLKDIQRETNLALVFVTHDLGIVAKLCDRVAVMYAGRIVETGTTREIFSRPRHPYTIGLLNCLPTLRRGREPLTAIDGQPPDLAAVPSGCAFAPALRAGRGRCSETRPGAGARRRRTPRRVPARRGDGDAHAAPDRDDAGRDVRGGGGLACRTATSSSRPATLTKHFPVARGAILEPRRRHGEGGGRRELRPAPRRDARARRRERLRQDDHGSPGAAPGTPDGRRDLLPRPRHPRSGAARGSASIVAPSRPCSRIPTARSTRDCPSARRWASR